MTSFPRYRQQHGSGSPRQVAASTLGVLVSEPSSAPSGAVLGLFLESSSLGKVLLEPEQINFEENSSVSFSEVLRVANLESVGQSSHYPMQNSSFLPKSSC